MSAKEFMKSMSSPLLASIRHRTSTPGSMMTTGDSNMGSSMGFQHGSMKLDSLSGPASPMSRTGSFSNFGSDGGSPKALNPRSYAHASAHRGTLKLSTESFHQHKFSPDHAEMEHTCQFYAKKHIYPHMHDPARPRTPLKSLKYSSQEHWDNSALHSPLKIGHIAPSPKGSTLTSEVFFRDPGEPLRK
jgi:hypothetical protein